MVVVGLFVGGFVTDGIAQELDKYRAVFILKFIENIQWPDQHSSISIGVLGNSRVLTELSNRINESGSKHRVSRIDYVEKAVEYDIVFVPDGVGIDIQTLVRRIGDKSVLLIAQSATKANQSADICFLHEEDKLRFILNQPTISNKGLVMNSKLQKFAASLD